MSASQQLSELECDVLNELRAYNDYWFWWARPLDVGGSNRSHHSATLANLVCLGLAESQQRRGSKVYRITDAGRAAIQKATGE